MQYIKTIHKTKNTFNGLKLDIHCRKEKRLKIPTQKKKKKTIVAQYQHLLIFSLEQYNGIFTFTSKNFALA
jgi:hypothetical protein